MQGKNWRINDTAISTQMVIERLPRAYLISKVICAKT